MFTHIRTHIQFYFVLIAALSFTVYMQSHVISRPGLLVLGIIQAVATGESIIFSVKDLYGWFGVLLALVHVAALSVYFISFMYAAV